MKDNEVIRTGRASVVNDWTYEFTDLPEPAAEMPYSTELGPVTGYEITCSERETDNPRTIEYDFTAVHSRTFVSISGSILWDDDYDRDGIRPDSVTVDLTADRKTLESFTATAKDNWEFHFDRLEKYEDTREIPYHIEAGEIAGYEMKQGDFSVSYHHIPETKTIYFALHFDDRNNQDGTRPEKIRASLMNGIETVSEKELSADTGWNCSFTGIPMNENGKEVLYSVDVPAVRGYVKTLTDDGFLLSESMETTSVTGEIRWNDSNDAEGKRPTDVQVNLYCNGNFLKSGKADKESGWKYAFTDLPRNQRGTRIRYTVGQSDVPGYDKSVNGLIITNTIRRSAKHDTESETEADKNSGRRNLSLLPLFLIGIPGIVILIALKKHQKNTR